LPKQDLGGFLSLACFLRLYFKHKSSKNAVKVFVPVGIPLKGL
jgi:hypothetical protein